MPNCSRFEKMLKMLKNNIPFMEKAKINIAYVEFDIMTVGGKQYLGKDEEW